LQEIQNKLNKYILLAILNGFILNRIRGKLLGLLKVVIFDNAKQN